MTFNELAKSVYQVCYLRGDFLLRSGQRSSEYFDKYRFEAQPKLLGEIAQQLKALVPPGTEMLAGLEMGGIPVATALSLATGLPVVFVRKEAKKYGTCKFAEGLEVKGRRVLVIEDVITTGGQVVASTRDLRQEGALIDHVLCVIFRGNDPLALQREAGLKLSHLFTGEQLKQLG